MSPVKPFIVFLMMKLHFIKHLLAVYYAPVHLTVNYAFCRDQIYFKVNTLQG